LTNSPIVNFKKLKEEGEEKIQAIREQLRNLDFKEGFIEQLPKDYPAKKIEEKLEGEEIVKGGNSHSNAK